MHALYQIFKIHKKYKKGTQTICNGSPECLSDLKMFFVRPTRTTWPILTKICTNHTLVKRKQLC